MSQPDGEPDGEPGACPATHWIRCWVVIDTRADNTVYGLFWSEADAHEWAVQSVRYFEVREVKEGD